MLTNMTETERDKLRVDMDDALIAVGTNRQGTPINVARTRAEVVDALRMLGLIGPGNGLTRKGTIARERARDAREALLA